MSLRYALLGLLTDQPASGYDLARRFERALQRYAWHAQHSQIYPELNRLAAEGLIRVTENGARGRRTYAITKAGRARLRHWLLNPPAEFLVRNELVLRLFLLSTLEPEDVRALLRPLAADSARELQRLKGEVTKADAATPAGNKLPFGRLAAEFGLLSFQSLHAWALWALEQIDQADVHISQADSMSIHSPRAASRSKRRQA